MTKALEAAVEVVCTTFGGGGGCGIDCRTCSCNQDTKAVVQSQIDALERTQLMPRATREFMLLSMESMATPEQLEQNFGYRAVKAFDLQIAALRAQL